MTTTQIAILARQILAAPAAEQLLDQAELAARVDDAQLAHGLRLMAAALTPAQ